MSGICGIVEPGQEIPRSHLQPMISALAVHTEPEFDAFAGPSVALGVSRRWDFQNLGAIPGIHIAVDADLLNVPELSKYLDGHVSQPDKLSLAQLLAWLYVLRGPEFLELLHGAFSISLWDEKRGLLLLAIDRLGLKSLYWRREGDRLLFASRVGAIPVAMETQAQVNPSAIMQYLMMSVIPAPLSIFSGVEKLGPGFALFFQNGEVRKKRYWDLEYVETAGKGESAWARELQAQMRTAVHQNLNDCRPETTGAYLSGGTDSSSVVAFISERFSPTNSFSISFSETPYNEIGFARTTAERFQTRHHELCVSPQDARDAIPKIIDYYQEPFANSSAIASFHCARLARQEGMDTLLAGDGGDELFGGNERYASDKKFALYHSLPGWVRRSLFEPAARLLPETDGRLGLPRRYIRRASLPNPHRLLSYNFFLSNDPAEIFEPGFLEQAPREQWLDIAEGHFRSARASNDLNRMLYLDVKITLADNDVRKVSGTAEMAGIRVRYPLMDHRLAEFSGRIPARLKLKGLEKRFIFKKAMKGILPERVLYKKKHGFGVPLALWLMSDPHLESLAKDVLNDSRTRQRGIFQPAFFDRLSELHRKDHASFYGEVIWYILVLELWYRQHARSCQEAARAR